MFPTQSKVNRPALSRLWLVPAIALVMLLVAYAVFAFSTAEAQTLPGDYCVEGIVINWEEKPLAGWGITLTNDIDPAQVLTTTSAPEPDKDEDDPDLEKGEFEFTEADGVIQAPGTYTAVIESRAGWEGVTPTTITFPIDVGEDDCVRIRFKMRRIIPVTAIKFSADHEPLEDWTIQAVPGPGNLFAEPQEEETGIDGTALFTLTPGLWIFSEYPPKQDRDEPRESYMPVVPPTGRQELLIDDDLPVATTLSVIFKNEQVAGCVAVQKIGVIDPAVPVPNGNTLPPTTPVLDPGGFFVGTYGVPGWGFTLERLDGSIARQGVTDATGRLEFDNLPFGPYVLVEENRSGWNEITDRELEIDVSGNGCDDIVGGVALAPDETEAIVFQNAQDDSGFCIEGRKIDANGGYGLAGWVIEIEPLAEGGYDPDDVTTDGLGKFTIEFPRNDYRIPGALYEVCEDEQDGWLPHTDTCQVVRLPEWPMGECVQLKDFVNQQVGHSESQKHDKHMGGPDKGNMDMGKGNNMDMGKGYMDMGKDGKSMHCSAYHVVKGGEGLYDIGSQYKVSPQAMLDANPEVRDTKDLVIYVGQRICIP